MKKFCVAVPLMSCFLCTPAFAESPLEACEAWAVKEDVEAADRAEYIEDCVDELSASDAGAAIESEDFGADYSDTGDQYPEPETDNGSEPGTENYDEPEIY